LQDDKDSAFNGIGEIPNSDRVFSQASGGIINNSMNDAIRASEQMDFNKLHKIDKG